MAVYREQHQFESRGHGHLCDLTSAVTAIVERSQITTGTAHIFNVGSTGAVVTIEFEPGLARDLPENLDRLLPPNTDYAHEQAWHDGNGHSHLQATVLGPEVTVPVSEGMPLLGTWQQLAHLECDTKPRRRTVVITVIGE
jgi:secondary thiamine-phosphate synthase enzyme